MIRPDLASRVSGLEGWGHELMDGAQSWEPYPEIPKLPWRSVVRFGMSVTLRSTHIPKYEECKG